MAPLDIDSTVKFFFHIYNKGQKPSSFPGKLVRMSSIAQKVRGFMWMPFGGIFIQLTGSRSFLSSFP